LEKLILRIPSSGEDKNRLLNIESINNAKEFILQSLITAMD